MALAFPDAGELFAVFECFSERRETLRTPRVTDGDDDISQELSVAHA